MRIISGSFFVPVVTIENEEGNLHLKKKIVFNVFTFLMILFAVQQSLCVRIFH